MGVVAKDSRFGVVGNQVSGFVNYGIEVTGSGTDGLVVRENVLRQTGTTVDTGTGVYFHDATGRIQVQANEIRQCEDGVYVLNVTGIDILDNQILASHRYGIYLLAGPSGISGSSRANYPIPDARMTGNVIQGSGTAVGVTMDKNAAQTVLDATGNYWGTTDANAIAQTIIDQEDHESRPTVDYDPFLSEPPDAVAAASLRGDVNDDGEISAADAVLILQQTAGLITLPDPRYPKLFRAIADVSGNGTISPYDATLILQFAVQLIDVFPADLVPAAPEHYRPLLEQLRVWMTTSRAGEAGTYLLPIQVSGASGVSSGRLQIEYDPVLLDVMSIQPSEETAHWDFQHQTGRDRATVAFAGVEPLRGDNVLAYLVVGPRSGNSRAIDSSIRLSYAEFNEVVVLGQPNLFDAVPVPDTTALFQNYPNPFNPETWIPYQLAIPADVGVEIYSSTGTVVRRIALGHQPAGMYQSREDAAYWDGRNDRGETVASGVYFYRFHAGEFVAIGKMMIVR